MNIAYVVWFESLQGRIIKGQVIEVLKNVSNISQNKNIYFFAFQPIHRILLHYRDFRNIWNELKGNGIKLVIIPSLILPKFINWFNAKFYVIPLIFLFSFPILLFLTSFKKINILHCRSYPIMLSAIIVKKINRRLKIIFDPRSDFPEENITAGNWTENSLTYKFWKKLEKMYLNESDITIAIVNTYVKHYKKISPKTVFSIIPNNVCVERFVSNNFFREKLRAKMGIRKNEILFCYCGSIGNHWHKPEIYARFIIKFRKLSVNHRFLFITPNKVYLENVFSMFGIRHEEYICVFSNFDDVPQYLSAADFGLMLMSRYKIAMAIKTAEYLAMGLPIIINSKPLGAKEIIDQYGIGLVIENMDNINYKDVEKFIQKKDKLSLKCRKIACNKFSTKKVATQYIEVYDKVY